MPASPSNGDSFAPVQKQCSANHRPKPVARVCTLGNKTATTEGEQERSYTVLSRIVNDIIGIIMRLYVPLKCERATGWKGPLELGASTTIVSPGLLHVNI